MDATLHDLRRTCLTMLRSDLGYSTENVKDYIGHSSITVTENHYLGRSMDQQLEKGSALGRYLSDLASNSIQQTEAWQNSNGKRNKNTDMAVIYPPRRCPIGFS